VVLALVGATVTHPTEIITLLTDAGNSEDLLTAPQEFSASDTPQDSVGADGAGDGGLVSEAPLLAMPAAAPSALEVAEPPTTLSHGHDRLAIDDEIRMATGPKFAESARVRGAAGVGATAATGAIDRITQEILASLEVRKTLVVWLFDQSGS